MSLPKKKPGFNSLPANINESLGDTFGKVPPNSIPAEEAVIGSVLLDNDSLNIALETLSDEDFYRPAHQIIFQAMRSLWERREAIDLVTLSQKLKGLGQLEVVGGFTALSQLASMIPSAANITFYARLVKECSLKRRVIREGMEMVHEAFQETGDIEEFLDGVERRVLSISDSRIAPSFHRAGEVVQDSIRLIEELYDRKELITGVASGFPALDRMTAGFQPSDLSIIAARPGMGKTSLALSIASNIGVPLSAASGKGKAVAIFSLEMSKEQLVVRLLCSLADVDSSKVRSGRLENRDFPKLVEAAGRIAESSIFIDDTGALTITELRAKCRRLHKEHPLSVVIVDYLQLLRSPAYQKFREQEISDISRSLKALAKELHVPVIALSQLNRSVESRENKRPQMSDLRESGAIEQDADIVMFIYRDEVYNPETRDPGVAEVLIAKQRNGPVGTVRLAFIAKTTTFATLEEGYAPEVVAQAIKGVSPGSVIPVAENIFADLDDPTF
jgi:replicative DNA helicase